MDPEVVRSEPALPGEYRCGFRGCGSRSCIIKGVQVWVQWVRNQLVTSGSKRRYEAKVVSQVVDQSLT